MFIEKARDWSENLLEPLVESLDDSGVSPNVLSIISLFAAFLAGGAFYRSLFLLGGLLVAINSVLDALDGSLARRKEIQSKRGDLMDHTIDRFADVAILVGISFSPQVSLGLGLFAVIGVLLTSYMGTQAQAVGAGRIYSGYLGRAYRLILIVIVSIIAGLTSFSGLSMNLLLGFFGVIGIYTAVQRFLKAWKGLS